VEKLYRCEGKEYRVKVEASGEGFLAAIDGRRHSVRILRKEPGVLDLEVDGRRRRIHLAGDAERRFLSLEGIAYRLDREDPAARARTLHESDRGLEARMPGLVRSVPVAEGDRVERGTTLVVLEAMKMEIRVTAPHPGIIERIHCREGQQVDRGQVLVEISPE
jgi:acetyl/propionyl-CoA carboxylase alpha subunit